MITDPIVREVREIRHQIDQECEKDPEKYYQYLKALQDSLIERLVCRQPKPLVTPELKKAG